MAVSAVVVKSLRQLVNPLEVGEVLVTCWVIARLSKFSAPNLNLSAVA